MPVLAPAIATGVLGLAKSAFGIGQEIKANKRAKLLNRPKYNIQDEYFNNQSLAEDMAQSGLSDTSLNFYKQNAERGMAAGIDATLQTGGNVNNVVDLYDRYNSTLGAVAVKDDELQTDKIRYLIDQNKTLAGQKSMKWAIDEYEPYKDEALSIAKQKEAGINNIFGGAQEVVGAASSYAASKAYEGQTSQFGNAGKTMGQINGNPTIQSAQGFTVKDIVQSQPDWYQGLAPAKQNSIQDILDKYKNSPYIDGMPNYLLQNIA